MPSGVNPVPIIVLLGKFRPVNGPFVNSKTVDINSIPRLKLDFVKAATFLSYHVM